MLQDGSIFTKSPSFNSYSSDNFSEIAAKVCEEFVDDRVQLGLEPVINDDDDDDDDDKPGEIVEEEKDDQQQEETEEDEFEFCFLSGDGIAISADEIFANGQIRPVFPVFNRDLLLFADDEPKKNSSLRKLFIGESEEEEEEEEEEEDVVHSLENLPAGTYCVWKPKQSSSPDTCKKSKSTGSSSSSSQSATDTTTTTCVFKRWRFRDFLFRRSNSDGKDTFVFLTPSSTSTTDKLMMMKKNRKEEEKLEEEKVVVYDEKKKQHDDEGKVVGKGKLKTSAQVSAHETHYVRNRAWNEKDRKKSYLPYRQDLVGFFANVTGLNRNLHPF